MELKKKLKKKDYAFIFLLALILFPTVLAVEFESGTVITNYCLNHNFTLLSNLTADQIVVNSTCESDINNLTAFYNPIDLHIQNIGTGNGTIQLYDLADKLVVKDLTNNNLLFASDGITDDYNVTFNTGVIIQIINDSENPNVALNTPSNNTFSDSSSNNFTSNLTDNLGIKNATIYIYNSTDLVNETTITFSDSPIQYSWGLVVDLSDDVYTWFVKLFDFAGNSETSENYTLTVDSNFPRIEQPISPVDDSTSDSSDINFTANLTDDVGVENITLYIYNSTGDLINETTDTFPSKPKQTIWSKIVTLVDGVYTWFISIFDTAGNEDSTVNRTITLESNLTIRLKLDENSTTTAHDVSANENHATLINSTWGNDGVLVTLTEDTDYTLNTATGLFTIINYDYSWTGIYTDYNYESTSQETGYLTLSGLINGLSGGTGWIAIIIIIGFVIVIISFTTVNLKPDKNISEYKY